MQRMTVAEAGQDFPNLVDRICSEGIIVELERGKKVVARLTPAAPQSRLKVRDLNAFLQRLPPLGADAQAFEDEVRELRQGLPAEANPWD